ncbi:MAG: hypothetical protein LBU87_05220, partial [Lactobacillales bacterium]|nr:hypothetical protein [Lactobacillales bacterium]
MYKTHSFRKHLVSLGILCAFAGAAPTQAGETVDYPGAALQDIPYLAGNVLAPSGIDDQKTDSLTDNTVTMNSGSVTYIYGGFNMLDADIITGNQIIINDGTATFEVA